MKKKLSIGFISEFSPKDRSFWSGIPYTAYRLLERHHTVEWVNPEISRLFIRVLKARKGLALLLGGNYDWTHALALSRYLGKRLTQKLRGQEFDVLLATAASTSLAFLDTDIPIIYLSDTTFGLIHNYYGNYSKLCRQNVNEGNLIERRALGKASAVVVASEWARRSVVDDYKISPSKAHVVQFAPNIERLPEADDIRYRRGGSMNLLFVGIDWNRKGGDIAIKTYNILKRRYPNCRLRIVGGSPRERLSDRGIEIHGLLDQAKPEDMQKLVSFYLDTDFFLLPTQAEAAGIVFAEASAFGVPSLTFDTGGVRSYVEDNVNGYVLAHDANETAFAERIISVYDSPSDYERLRKSTRLAFETRFSAERWEKSLEEILESVLEKASPRAAMPGRDNTI